MEASTAKKSKTEEDARVARETKGDTYTYVCIYIYVYIYICVCILSMGIGIYVHVCTYADFSLFGMFWGFGFGV